MSLEESREVFQYLDDYKEYRKNGMLHGVMGSILTPLIRTVYSMAKDDRFTVAMLRDLIDYRSDKDGRDLCLVTDQPSAFDRLRTLLEERYNFVCVVEDDVMYSFYFKEQRG